MGERILLTRLRYIGDVVLTTPCIERLRENLPNSRIDYLTEAPYGEILQQHPSLSRILSVPFASLGARGSMRLMRELMKTRYDLVIDLFSNPRSALLTASTLARRRVGTYHRSRNWAYNVRVRVDRSVRCAVEHHLEHLRRIGLRADFTLPRVFVTAEEVALGHKILKRQGVKEPSGTVLLQPGAKWQAKTWPADRFRTLAGLIRKESLEVAFLAGPGEEHAVRMCVDEEQTGWSRSNGWRIPVVGSLKLRELMMVLSAAAGYVGSDGGPAHLSAALGKPTVIVFGPSEPDIWFPYASQGRAACVYEAIECRPCHLHACEKRTCLENVTAQRVCSELMRIV